MKMIESAILCLLLIRCCAEGADQFKFRLVGGPNNASGRVEVLHNGSWGTVCDAHWDVRDAKVICQAMGFTGALEGPRDAKFGEGSGPIFLRKISCTVKASNFGDCRYEVGDFSSCDHGRDAGAICYTEDPFEVRLVNGSNQSEGRVEISVNNGPWGTICDHDWDVREARLVCRILGFGGSLAAPKSARFGRGSGPILLDWIECRGSERSLADCYHPGVQAQGYCGQGSAGASAVCYSGESPFEVRLVGGSYESEGRVEVSVYNGPWGTICDENWSTQDADVVCRMLAFSGASSSPGAARFGEGSGPILLSGVLCFGWENNLAQCQHDGVGNHSYCGHGRDAGVVCYPAENASTSEGVTIKSDCNLKLILGLSIPPSYMITFAALVIYICKARKNNRNKSHANIVHRSMELLPPHPDYQGLNSPPQLPARDIASSQDGMSRITMALNQSSLADEQSIQQGISHNQQRSRDGEDIDGHQVLTTSKEHDYCTKIVTGRPMWSEASLEDTRATGQTDVLIHTYMDTNLGSGVDEPCMIAEHEYMDIHILRQRSKHGTKDIDEYLIPNESSTEFRNMVLENKPADKNEENSEEGVVPNEPLKESHEMVLENAPTGIRGGDNEGGVFPNALSVKPQNTVLENGPTGISGEDNEGGVVPNTRLKESQEMVLENGSTGMSGEDNEEGVVQNAPSVEPQNAVLENEPTGISGEDSEGGVVPNPPSVDEPLKESQEMVLGNGPTGIGGEDIEEVVVSKTPSAEPQNTVLENEPLDKNEKDNGAVSNAPSVESNNTMLDNGSVGINMDHR